jgi:hypothetical protein
LNDFVVVDVKRSIGKEGDLFNVDLVQIEGESQEKKIEGKQSFKNKKINY